MAGHDPRERRLFTDLAEKNRLAGEARRIAHRLGRWRDRAASRRGKRWSARYAKSIAKAEARLVELRSEVLARAEELKARIQQEQKVSKTEVAQLEKQYQKEVAELQQAQQALADARAEMVRAREAQTGSSEPADAEKAALVLAALRRKNWSAADELRRETQELRKAEREVASEQADKAVLAYELRRITAEIEALRG